MSPEIIFDPYTRLYSEATGFIRSSAVRDLMSIIGRPDIISFGGGLPYMRGLPPAEVASVMNDVMCDNLPEALQYGETEGLESLKVRLTDLMAEEGIKAEPEHVLITSGSQQALDLLGRIFINHGDNIVMEGPSYIGALGAFMANGPNVITIRLDDMGIRTDKLSAELERRDRPAPKFLYVVPNFHNPAGVTMSADRREDLLRLAEEHDLLIIEDNPYGLLRFEGKACEPLVSRDQKRVVYLGTLSKTVSPGIRVGWVLAPAPILEKITTLKQSADLCSSTLNQMFAEAYITRGLWKKNLDILRPIYHSRRDAMLSALEEHFPEEAQWTRPEGGLFIWVTLPDYLDTAKMLPLAIDQKVAYVPGDAFFADGTGSNNMRLNFSFPSEEQIIEGIERLGKVIKREMELYHSLRLDR